MTIFSSSSRCPPLIQVAGETDSDSNSNQDSNSNNKYPHAWPYWSALIALFIVGGLIYAIYRSKTGAYQQTSVTSPRPKRQADEECGEGEEGEELTSESRK
jgi:hypothetical protein